MTGGISKYMLFALCMIVCSISTAQFFSINGNVRDANNGEDLVGATIIVEGTTNGTTTNTYGYYSLSVTKSTDTVIVAYSYLGYQTQCQKLVMDKDITLNIRLSSVSRQIDEVVVLGNSYQDKVNATQTSLSSITSKEAKLIPVIFGEVDLLKILQMKPGVQNPGEGFSGLYVRGGGNDQNLFLLDGATVFNPSHLFGFFSVFNADAVKSIDLYKGGFPAQYGGRLSSIVDVKMNEGNRNKFSGAGGIGLISSRLTLEGPIDKGKGSFIVSGRRTYFDTFTRLYNKSQEGVKDFTPIPDYYFYDLTAKVNYELGKKDRLYLSGYFGRDVFGFNQRNIKIDFDWGNTVGNLRWNHIFNPKWFANTSFSVSDYRYNITNNIDVIRIELGSTVREHQLKYDLEYAHNQYHQVKLGLSYCYHTFALGRVNVSSSDGLFDFNTVNNIDAQSAAIYISDDYEISPRLKLNAGVRMSLFYNIRSKSMYINPEPRVSARFKLTESTSLKASYARMYQYSNLISNSGASLPWDFWYPANSVIRPQISDQVAAGFNTTFGNGDYLFSIEGFYKYLQRQIDLRDGAQLFLNDNLDAEFVFGRGWAYGSEVYLEKKEGKTRGWIGYTLQWNQRQFDAINDGNVFPSRFDRRHDISVVLTHDISKKIMLSMNFVYSTGNATTLPVARYFMQDLEGATPTPVPVYGYRNSFRLAAYYRLDFGLVYKFKHKWGESDLTFSIYNVLDRRNPFFVYFDELRSDDDTQVLGFQAKQVSLFPIIPAVTWNFKF